MAHSVGRIAEHTLHIAHTAIGHNKWHIAHCRSHIDISHLHYCRTRITHLILHSYCKLSMHIAQPAVLLSAQTPEQPATPSTTKKDICPAVTTVSTAHTYLNGRTVKNVCKADTKQRYSVLYTQDTAPLQLTRLWQSVLCCSSCCTNFLFFCWARFALVAAGQAVYSSCFK